ncbi:MAG TPA: UBP-type zinc finger domain-containing protein [Pseudonocardiaceae bacterium]|nr:UBP-type zinc finger domain-containing protein [Pseudonocardiaceae bacterium]
MSSATATCVHVADLPADVTATTPDGCEECLALGEHNWVHLRMCLACGHVGCCDSSRHKHATAHFGSTGHAVIRSLEPGESWRWCYVDERLV